MFDQKAAVQHTAALNTDHNSCHPEVKPLQRRRKDFWSGPTVIGAQRAIFKYIYNEFHYIMYNYMCLCAVPLTTL